MTAAKKTAKKAVNANGEFEVTPVHFVIEVNLEQDDHAPKPYPVPRNIPREMHRGDTVSYESPDGQVTVKFAKDQDGSVHTSPYTDENGHDIETVHGGERFKVGNSGTYLGKCSIRVTERKAANAGGAVNALKAPVLETIEREYTWNAKTPEAGGNHIVKP